MVGSLEMTIVADEFLSKVQIARKKILMRYLMWLLCFLIGFGVVRWLVQPFPDYVFMAVWFACGIVLLSSPIRSLQKMTCPYFHHPSRVSILPFGQIKCMHCHGGIVESLGADQSEGGR